MTCTSQLFDPSVESDLMERNLQHNVGWKNLSSESQIVRLTSGEGGEGEGEVFISLSGRYAACGFEILLARKHEILLYQVYCPCILFVTVSWISFIINPTVNIFLILTLLLRSSML